MVCGYYLSNIAEFICENWEIFCETYLYDLKIVSECCEIHNISKVTTYE